MRLLTLLALAGTLVCCAGSRTVTGPGPAPIKTIKSVPTPGNLSGVWDWLLRSANEQGDVRIEQEEWHLDQQGPRLSGYYDRQVMILSTDQRPFQCNGALGYTKTARVRVAGEIHHGVVSLQEVAANAQPNPCDSGARNLMSYTGELRGDSLRLDFSPGGSQYLTRRPPGAPKGAMASFGASAQDGPERRDASSSVSLDGVWDWELSTVDADGDLRVEREEWHLSETDATLSGYYERTELRTRTGGTFPCNGDSTISTATRYTVRGQRFGERTSLSEIDYKTQAGPCDNAQRRLDSYQGAVSQSGQELILSWGTGTQVLHRRR